MEPPSSSRCSPFSKIVSHILKEVAVPPSLGLVADHSRGSLLVLTSVSALPSTKADRPPLSGNSPPLLVPTDPGKNNAHFFSRRTLSVHLPPPPHNKVLVLPSFYYFLYSLKRFGAYFPLNSPRSSLSQRQNFFLLHGFLSLLLRKDFRHLLIFLFFLVPRNFSSISSPFSLCQIEQLSPFLSFVRILLKF